MKAFFVYCLDNYSGAAQQAMLLAQALDCNITIFNVNFKKFRRWKLNKKIDVIDLPKSISKQIIIIIFFTLLKNIRVYHLHGFSPAALIAGRLLFCKMIIKTTLMGEDDLESLKTSSFGGLKRWLIQQTDINVVLSKQIETINSKHLSKTRIVRIPNGTLVPKTCVEYNQKENAYCFVGLVCPRKRPLESIKHFAKNYADKNSKLYIVGPYELMYNNQEFDKAYAKDCLDFVKRNNLDQNIIFTGKIGKEKTQSIFAKCKALLFFPLKEGMPNVVLEAMAYNCVPVVSETDGVMSEIFENGKEGLIIDPNDSVDVKRIDGICASKATYKRACMKFSIDSVAGKYIKLYKSL